MNEVRNWATLMLGCLILCVISEFFIPTGKIGKTINIILSLFVMTSFLTLIIPKNKLFSEFHFDSPKINLKSYEKFQKKINDQTNTLAEKNIKSIIKQLLLDNNISAEKIEIFMDRNEDNCILIIKCKIYILNEDVTVKEKIKNEIEKKLNIETEIISKNEV